MSMMLIQPGRSATLRHPKTGEPVTPIGYRKNGTAIWPVLGASPDDEDPFPAGDDDDADDDADDEDDDDSDDDADEDDKSKTKKKPKHAKDDDADDEDDKPQYTKAEMDRVRNRMRAADKRSSDLEARLRRIENKGKKPEEIKAEEDKEREAKDASRETKIRETSMENAFLRSSAVAWTDPDDVFAIVLREKIMDDVMDEDGIVDRKALTRSLRDLAKRKPHLVKKASGPDEKDDDDQGSVSTPTMNGRRRGTRSTSDKATLAKRFPALRQ